MDFFSKDGTIISDIINRILNCRKSKELYVFGIVGNELSNLYPAVNIIAVKTQADITGDVVYLHIDNTYNLKEVIPWINKNRKKKDFILYISPKVEITHKELIFLGIPHQIEQYSNLAGTIFLVGLSFQIASEVIVPDDFKVLAIIHFYNEADIIENTIQYLLSQEIDLYLLDNWSDDGSFEIALKYRNIYPDRIFLEHFPLYGKTDNYEWYNQLEKTEQISMYLNYNWFIHYDVDEIRISPWENTTLKKAIYWIDLQGYNCIENTVIDFRFVKEDVENIFMKDTYFDFRHIKKWFDQIKTWKRSEYIELKSSGGHHAYITNPKIYPLKFLNKHYPLRSIEQAEKKVFQERMPRFRKENKERGWHVQYDRFKRLEDFYYHPSELLLWHKKTFQELYIPLFLECGIKWDEDICIPNIHLPEFKNKKLVIYGAGTIGRKVYQAEMGKNIIVGWVDKSHNIIPNMFCELIRSVENIINMDFDFLIIAIKNIIIQNEVKLQIKKFEIPDEKIICVQVD